MKCITKPLVRSFPDPTFERSPPPGSRLDLPKVASARPPPHTPLIHFVVYFDILSGISSDIFSGESSDIMSGILSSISSDIFSGISSDILSGISRDILSGTSFDILSSNVCG